MKDEGFLSPAGRRFVVLSGLLLLCGVIAYYTFSAEISLDFLDELGTETTTSSTTFDVPEVDVPDFSDPESSPFESTPPSVQPEIETAQDVFECLDRAEGDIEKIQACANQ